MSSEKEQRTEEGESGEEGTAEQRAVVKVPHSEGRTAEADAVVKVPHTGQ
jgi:hypothetical protein